MDSTIKADNNFYHMMIHIALARHYRIIMLAKRIIVPVKRQTNNSILVGTELGTHLQHGLDRIIYPYGYLECMSQGIELDLPAPDTVGNRRYFAAIVVEVLLYVGFKHVSIVSDVPRCDGSHLGEGGRAVWALRQYIARG